MKTYLPLLTAFACLGFSLSAQASDIDETILTSGTLSSSGTFSGSFLINSSTEMLDGGQITATVPGGGVYTFFASTGDSGIPGFESFFDGSGDMFELALNGPVSGLAVNTFAAYGGYDTNLVLGTGQIFSTMSGAVAIAPEPSSLVLLSTGALALAGLFRRRLLNA
jgi:hypothetical protein